MGLGTICLAIFLLFICGLILSNAVHHAKKAEKEKKEDNAAVKAFFIDCSRVQPRVEPKLFSPSVSKKKYRRSGYARSRQSSYDCSMDIAMMGDGGCSSNWGGGCDSGGGCDGGGGCD